MYWQLLVTGRWDHNWKRSKKGRKYVIFLCFLKPVLRYCSTNTKHKEEKRLKLHHLDTQTHSIQSYHMIISCWIWGSTDLVCYICDKNKKPNPETPCTETHVAQGEKGTCLHYCAVYETPVTRSDLFSLSLSNSFCLSQTHTYLESTMVTFFPAVHPPPSSLAPIWPGQTQSSSRTKRK